MEIVAAETAAIDLQLPRARSVASYLMSGASVAASLVSSQRSGSRETLIVDLTPEVGQLPKIDIRNVERVSITFDASDTTWPSVSALREDFPVGLPHTNGCEAGERPTLCIATERFTDLRHMLTAADLIERIRYWFGATSSGKLHQDDQALEPFIFGSGMSLILPSAMQDVADGVSAAYTVEECEAGWYRAVPRSNSSQRATPACLLILTTPARVHGLTRTIPRSLVELAKYIDDETYSLITNIRAALTTFRDNPVSKSMLFANLVLLLRTPLSREPGLEPERVDVKALWLYGLDGVAKALGVWEVHRGERIGIVKAEVSAAPLRILLLGVEYALDAELAAAYNGLSSATHPRFTAIGAGALGSQVLLNMARSAMRPSAIIDDDHLAPHNLARHGLFDFSVGYFKATALSRELDDLINDGHRTTAVPEDVMAVLTPVEK